MRRPFMTFVATAAALALCLGGSERDPGEKMNPAQVELITDTFNSVKNFWLAKGLGIGAVKLRLLNENDHACGIDGSDSQGLYCGKTDEVIITVAAMQTMETRRGGVRPSTVFVVSHEFGHVVQDSLNLLNGNNTPKSVIELQATCLAGVAMNALYPELIPPDEHTQEYEYFNRGVQGQNCFESFAKG